MNNVIQGNFKQVCRHYGHKKISQKGVEALQALEGMFLNQSSIPPQDMAMVSTMIADILDFEVTDKYFMAKGNQEI